MHKARTPILKSQVLLPLLTQLQHSEDYNTLWVGGGIGNINFMLTVSGGKHTLLKSINQSQHCPFAAITQEHNNT